MCFAKSGVCVLLEAKSGSCVLLKVGVCVVTHFVCFWWSLLYMHFICAFGIKLVVVGAATMRCCQQRRDEASSIRTANERYEVVKRTLKQTAEEMLPRAPMKVNGKIKYLGDERLNKRESFIS